MVSYLKSKHEDHPKWLAYCMRVIIFVFNILTAELTVNPLTVVLDGQCVIVLTVEFIGKQSV